MPVDLIKRRFTADDYQRMGEAGILSSEDRVELIDGEVTAMSPIGPRHSSCIDRANHLLVTRLADQAIVRIQSSLRLDRFNEPEPDIMLLRPRDDFYVSRLPGAADVLLLIEVAESSLEYDRDAKSVMYARAGIPEYWIADLNLNRLLCYSQPEDGTYRVVHHHGVRDLVTPLGLQTLTIEVGALFGA